MTRPFILAETNYAQTKATPYEVAVLPLGATEPHNLHLPYGTDSFQATGIGERLCAEAHARGAKVVLLPTIPYGTETNMRRFPLALNVDPSTLQRFVTDIIRSCVNSGVRKVVLLNSHGGNELKPLLRELAGAVDAQLFLCNWYTVLGADYGRIFANRDDHAGEMETSFMLRFHPGLVARNADGSLAADDGAVKATRFDAVNQGWVGMTRPWHLLTTNTGSGNPHHATAEKGEALMQALVERLVPFLCELSAAEVDATFPY